MFSLRELIKFNWRRHKARAFRDHNHDITCNMSKLKTLSYEHFMKCFKPAWDIAFNKEHTITRWRIEGMIPFTCHALWKKVQEDEVIASKSASNSTTTGTPPSSTPSPATVKALASDATFPTPSGLLITPPMDPSAPSLCI